MKLTVEEFKKKLLSTLLITPETTFYVAYSGGGDSHTLLHLSHALFPHRTHALYVKHNFRPPVEQEAEVEHVRQITENLCVPLTIREAEWGYSQRPRQNQEARGRRLRYDFFDQVIRETPNSFLLLGHHAGDQAETVVQRLFQGSSTLNLAMPKSRERLFRPFWDLSPEILDEYRSRNKISPFEDSSNRSEKYLRNGIRTLLFPRLGVLFPQYAKGLSQTIENLEELKTFAQEESERRIHWSSFPLLRRIGESQSRDYFFQIEAREFFQAQPLLRKLSLLKVTNQLLKGEVPTRIPSSFYAPLLKAVGENPPRRGGGHGLGWEIKSGNFFFYREDIPLSPPVKLRLNQRVSWQGVEYLLTRFDDPPPQQAEILGTLSLPPLEGGEYHVSSPDGEHFFYLKGGGRKRLVQWLGEKGLPPKIHSLVPVIFAVNRPVLIIGQHFLRSHYVHGSSLLVDRSLFDTVPRLSGESWKLHLIKIQSESSERSPQPRGSEEVR